MPCDSLAQVHDLLHRTRQVTAADADVTLRAAELAQVQVLRATERNISNAFFFIVG